MMGCSPGWGCEAVINHQNKAFDLQKTVEVSHGNYAAMMADTITRFKEGKPVLYYTWTPYWVSDVMKPGKDVVWLQVPFSSLPGEQKNIDTKLPNGANYGSRLIPCILSPIRHGRRKTRRRRNCSPS